MFYEREYTLYERERKLCESHHFVRE